MRFLGHIVTAGNGNSANGKLVVATDIKIGFDENFPHKTKATVPAKPINRKVAKNQKILKLFYE